ncbi:hypothetical protein Dimus_030843 [Dionaea muscipula]
MASYGDELQMAGFSVADGEFLDSFSLANGIGRLSDVRSFSFVLVWSSSYALWQTRLATSLKQTLSASSMVFKYGWLLHYAYKHGLESINGEAATTYGADVELLGIQTWTTPLLLNRTLTTYDGVASTSSVSVLAASYDNSD